MRAVEAAVRRLRRLQHPDGSWTDFLVAVGSSNAWVTGYVGFALAAAASAAGTAGTAGTPGPDAGVRALAGRAADAAADWLLAHPGRGGAWGYHARVQPDADSTAWAIRLLAARGRAVPAAALEFLAGHESDGGYRTYRERRSGRWSEPTPDVSAAALLARYEAGALDRAALAAGWTRLVGPGQRAPGRWTSMWWSEDGYPTMIAVEAWVAAGRPGLAQAPLWLTPPETAFGHALWLHAGALAGAAGGAGALLALERPGGGWAGDADLLVPGPRGGGVTERSRDARGTFTTATALRALLAVPTESSAAPTARRDPAGVAYDGLIGGLAADLGVDAEAAVAVFRALTRESLALPAPWPAEQLSALAGGLPVELSAGTGRRALRYTAEIGEPELPPYERAAGGLRAIGRAAALLGYEQAWARVQPAVREMVDPALAVGGGCRFWVWAGVDAHADGGAVLKVYLSALHHDAPGGRDRVGWALNALGVPRDAPALAALDRLEPLGFCHELGIALAPGGRIGAKAYYELDGWQPDVVAALLAEAGLPADPAAVRPEIPGVLAESLAATRRSGIALRVLLPAGTVGEVTVTSAFPRPMIGDAEIARRVAAWLGDRGSGTYDAVVARLLPGRPAGAPPLHSLFTRTRSAAGVSDTVYLRPAYPTLRS
jgi:hypothetical protein